MNAFHSRKKHMCRSSNIRSDRYFLRLHFPRPDIAKRPKSLAAISLPRNSRGMRRIESRYFGSINPEGRHIRRFISKSRQEQILSTQLSLIMIGPSIDGAQVH